VQFLDLLPSNTPGAVVSMSCNGGGSVLSANCLQWYSADPLQLVRGWCEHFINYVSKNSRLARVGLSFIDRCYCGLYCGVRSRDVLNTQTHTLSLSLLHLHIGVCVMCVCVQERERERECV